jgi:hypothetical protein
MEEQGPARGLTPERLVQYEGPTLGKQTGGGASNTPYVSGANRLQRGEGEYL